MICWRFLIILILYQVHKYLKTLKKFIVSQESMSQIKSDSKYLSLFAQIPGGTILKNQEIWGRILVVRSTTKIPSLKRSIKIRRFRGRKSIYQKIHKNVHLFYQNCVKISDGQYPEFQDLWEIVMIRSTSEAICETVGSMMNQHSGRNRHLDPTYFSMEMVLRFNLGPLHLLDTLIDDILTTKPVDFVRKETRENRISSGDVNTSAAVNTFREKREKKISISSSILVEKFIQEVI